MQDRNNTDNSYDDIINHPHHVSTRHPKMSMIDRAAQFSPFAALTGYGDVIKETARLTDRKPELSESEKAELDYKLRMACDYPGEKPALTITYFVPDQRKAGGSYHTISGQIKKIDDYQKQVSLMDKTRIDIDCILDIDGQIYELVAKIGIPAPSACSLGTTLPEFQPHFHALKPQCLIIGLAQPYCD